jgi:hypothetical protein
MSRKVSQLEKDFASQIVRYRLPPAIREFEFADDAFGRKWRFDFYFEPYLLAVECHGLKQGGPGNRRGGHETIPGMTNDADKSNAAALLHITVLTFFQSHIAHKTNGAIHMTMRALTVRGWGGPGT